MKYTSFILAAAYIRKTITDTSNPLVDFDGFDDDGPWATTAELAADKTIAFLNGRDIQENWITPKAFIDVQTVTLSGDHIWAGYNVDDTGSTGGGFPNLITDTATISSVDEYVLTDTSTYSGQYPYPTDYKIFNVTLTASWSDTLDGTYTAPAYFVITGVPEDTAQLVSDDGTYFSSTDFNLFDSCGYGDVTDGQNGLVIYTIANGYQGTYTPPSTPYTVINDDLPGRVDNFQSILVVGLTVSASAQFQLAWTKSDGKWYPKEGEPYPLKYKNGVSMITLDFDGSRHAVIRPSKDGGFLIYEVDSDGEIISLIRVFRSDRTLAAVINKDLLNPYTPR